jgi:hypothetical protein
VCLCVCFTKNLIAEFNICNYKILCAWITVAVLIVLVVKSSNLVINTRKMGCE